MTIGFTIAFSLLALLGLALALKRTTKFDKGIGVALVAIGAASVIGIQAIEVASKVSTPDVNISVRVPK